MAPTNLPPERRRNVRRDADEAADWLRDTLTRMESKQDDLAELVTDVRIKQVEFVTRSDFSRWQQETFEPVREQSDRTDTRLKTLAAAVTLAMTLLGALIALLHTPVFTTR